ncbi:MAG: hypothetical protein ACI84O_000249 [Myxococcota bacterium]
MHSEFYTAAQQEFVLVSLDFPQGEEAKAAVPNPARNDELMKKYAVRGFPTVMIVNPNGDALGQTGYQDMDPADYFVDVQRLRDTGIKALVVVKELEKEFEAAEDKLVVALKAMKQLASMEPGTPGLGTVADIVRQGIALTEKADEKISMLKAVLAATSPTAADKELITKLDSKNEHGLMLMLVLEKMNSLQSEEDLASFIVMADALVATGNVEAGEDSLIIYVSAAYFLNEHLSDADAAKVWAQRAQDQGGLDERMQEVIDDILGTSPFEDDSDF